MSHQLLIASRKAQCERGEKSKRGREKKWRRCSKMRVRKSRFDNYHHLVRMQCMSTVAVLCMTLAHAEVAQFTRYDTMS